MYSAPMVSKLSCTSYSSFLASTRPPRSTKGSFICYVITFLGFLDPPPPLRKHAFSAENNQKLAFSDPPPPLQVINVIYEWSSSDQMTNIPKVDDLINKLDTGQFLSDQFIFVFI